MKPIHFTAITLLFAASASFPQGAAGASAGSTGQCKDGSYTTNATKKGACAGHQGVKDWFADAAAAPVTIGTAQSPVVAGAAASTTPNSVSGTVASPRPAAPGGGAGQVWVNTKSSVYHCFGTPFYGKTKQGQYMTEAAAKAAGDRADRGKACS